MEAGGSLRATDDRFTRRTTEVFPSSLALGPFSFFRLLSPVPRSGPICFTNAYVLSEPPAASLRFANRVLFLNAPPLPGDRVFDLHGAFVFPGLINAHEHLELNHFGRVKFQSAYQNASEWIEDLRPRLRADPSLRRGQAYSLADRLFIGGLKNLLSGATTVAHHNPFYRELRGNFPVRVLNRYGWAHSFHLEGQSAGAKGESAGNIRQRYQATPADTPFILHLAEGVDEAARAEVTRLESLDCLGPNTILVHGVGISLEAWKRIVQAGSGLVWCPASNLFLLGQSAAVNQFLDASPESSPRIGLGTDSRLTGSRDLLEEMRIALATSQVTPQQIFQMATINAARLLRLPQAGRIASGLPADLFILPRLSDDPYTTLLSAERKDVQLVVIGGRPLFGAPEFSDIFSARGVKVQRIYVDGVPKLIEHSLARRIQRCAISEPGVHV
jgi:cytosine/adenosine deaminase-related metal-dependent hydrolase